MPCHEVDGTERGDRHQAKSRAEKRMWKRRRQALRSTSGEGRSLDEQRRRGCSTQQALLELGHGSRGRTAYMCMKTRQGQRLARVCWSNGANANIRYLLCRPSRRDKVVQPPVAGGGEVSQAGSTGETLISGFHRAAQMQTS